MGESFKGKGGCMKCKIRKALEKLANEICDQDGEVYEEILLHLSRKAPLKKACKQARKILEETDGAS